MKYWMLLFAFLWVSYGTGMARKTEKIVNNGIPWFDDRGEIVNAHSAALRHFFKQANTTSNKYQVNGEGYVFNFWRIRYQNRRS